MKKKIIVLGCIMTFVLALSIFNKNDYKKETMKDAQKSQIISLNVEQTAGAGDYKAVTQNTWPTDGYEFNKYRSGCENGSILSWDDTKKSVIMGGDLSDKCYVYFDKIDLVCPESFNITKKIDYSNTIPAFFASELNYSITKNYNIDKLIITKTTGEIIEVPYDVETNMFSSFEDSIGASGVVGIQKIGVGTLSFINGSSCNIEFTLTIDSSSNEL